MLQTLSLNDFGNELRTYELKVICDISLISVPVGPHGSLLVANLDQQDEIADKRRPRTISNLDLDARVSFRHILDTSYDLGHDCGYFRSGVMLERESKKKISRSMNSCPSSCAPSLSRRDVVRLDAPMELEETMAGRVIAS